MKKNEVVDTGTEDGSTYVDVDRSFPFLPKYTGSKDQIAFIDGTTDAEFYTCYLNKPKVVKVESKLSEIADEWKSVSYAYVFSMDVL